MRHDPRCSRTSAGCSGARSTAIVGVPAPVRSDASPRHTIPDGARVQLRPRSSASCRPRSSSPTSSFGSSAYSWQRAAGIEELPKSAYIHISCDAETLRRATKIIERTSAFMSCRRREAPRAVRPSSCTPSCSCCCWTTSASSPDEAAARLDPRPAALAAQVGDRGLPRRRRCALRQEVRRRQAARVLHRSYRAQGRSHRRLRPLLSAPSSVSTNQPSSQRTRPAYPFWRLTLCDVRLEPSHWTAGRPATECPPTGDLVRPGPRDRDPPHRSLHFRPAENFWPTA